MLVLTLVFGSAVLLVSGLGKLRASDSIRPFAERIGVPQRLIMPVNTLVVLAELITGVLLLVNVATRWASIAAALLASGFLAVQAVARIRGVTISYRCFGAIDTELRPAIST